MLIYGEQIHEKHPLKVKNFGIWIRYDSRSGTHNMYKEYREMSRTDAVKSLYQDMASRHRARFRTIHVRLSGFLEYEQCTNIPYRSSRSLRLRRPMTSAAHTSSSLPPRTSSSLFLTAHHQSVARRSSPLPDQTPSTRCFVVIVHLLGRVATALAGSLWRCYGGVR